MKIRVLDQAQTERLKTLTEDIIENVGFKVEDNGLGKLAEKAGAVVNPVDNNIRIPRALLRALLANVPVSFTSKSVTASEYKIGGSEQYQLGIVIDPFVIDYETKLPRRPNLDDVRRNTILHQQNDRISTISRMDFPVTDYTDATSTWRSLETHLLNHIKHYAVYAASPEDFRTWIKIAEMLCEYKGLNVGDIVTAAIPILSPLALVNINCEILKECTKRNIAVVPTVCPMAGTTSPYSIEATIIQFNAEVIFLAALTQMLNPGNPFLYAAAPSVADMRNGHDMYYTIDKVLWKIAMVELAKSYNMPVMAECCGTLGHHYDMQSGAEGMLFMLAAQNTGADLLSGIGSCYNANGISSEMIVIQSEWIKISEFLTRGVDSGKIERGYQSIKEQGPCGNFLMDDLTIEMLRQDGFYSSGLFDVSGGYESSPSMLEKAHRIVEELTADFESPVPHAVQENIKRFFHDMYKGMS